MNLSVIPYVRSSTLRKNLKNSFLHSVAPILPPVHIFIYTYKHKVLKNVVFSIHSQLPVTFFNFCYLSEKTLPLL